MCHGQKIVQYMVYGHQSHIGNPYSGDINLYLISWWPSPNMGISSNCWPWHISKRKPVQPFNPTSIDFTHCQTLDKNKACETHSTAREVFFLDSLNSLCQSQVSIQSFPTVIPPLYSYTHLFKPCSKQRLNPSCLSRGCFSVDTGSTSWTPWYVRACAVAIPKCIECIKRSVIYYILWLIK